MLRSSVHSNYKKKIQRIKNILLLFQHLSCGLNITAIKKVYYFVEQASSGLRCHVLYWETPITDFGNK